MFNQFGLGREFFEVLFRIDEELAEQVRGRRCSWCSGGPLHRGNFRAETTRCAHRAGRRGARGPLQLLLRLRRVPEADHAAIASIPREAGVPRRRRDCGQHRRARARGHWPRGGQRRASGADNAALARVVAGAVHLDGGVRDRERASGWRGGGRAAHVDRLALAGIAARADARDARPARPPHDRARNRTGHAFGGAHPACSMMARPRRRWFFADPPGEVGSILCAAPIPEPRRRNLMSHHERAPLRLRRARVCPAIANRPPFPRKRRRESP